jgi:hypothetical protein
MSAFTHEESVKGARMAGLLVRDCYGKRHFIELGKRSAAVRRGRFVRIPLVCLPGESRRETAKRYGIHLRTLYYALRKGWARG